VEPEQTHNGRGCPGWWYYHDLCRVGELAEDDLDERLNPESRQGCHPGSWIKMANHQKNYPSFSETFEPHS